MSPLNLGFVPLTDAAPLIVAQAKGFFAAEGVRVALRREVAWSTVRDKLAVGALEGAHLLSPLAAASRLGEGALIAPLILNRGGAAVSLSTRIGAGGEAAADLRRLITRRREQGASELTFAVVFPQSIHSYLLRRWLTDAGIDPRREVKVTVAPPPRMAELLADGVIEGFCAGEPWNAAALASGAGRVVARAADIWPGAPDKVLAVRDDLVEPERLAAVVRAVRVAMAWCEDPANRRELVGLLARPEHLGVAGEIIAARLDEVGFGPGAPTEADAAWLVQQMSQWTDDDAAAVADAARRTFRTELAAPVPGGTPGF